MKLRTCKSSPIKSSPIKSSPCKSSPWNSSPRKSLSTRFIAFALIFSLLTPHNAIFSFHIQRAMAQINQNIPQDLTLQAVAVQDATGRGLTTQVAPPQSSEPGVEPIIESPLSSASSLASDADSSRSSEVDLSEDLSPKLDTIKHLSPESDAVEYASADSAISPVDSPGTAQYDASTAVPDTRQKRSTHSSTWTTYEDTSKTFTETTWRKVHIPAVAEDRYVKQAVKTFTYLYNLAIMMYSYATTGNIHNIQPFLNDVGNAIVKLISQQPMSSDSQVNQQIHSVSTEHILTTISSLIKKDSSTKYYDIGIYLGIEALFVLSSGQFGKAVTGSSQAGEDLAGIKKTDGEKKDESGSQESDKSKDRALTESELTKINKWKYRPSDTLYISHKKVFDNPHYYNQATGAINWPPHDGFLNQPVNITLQEGTKIDRYGLEAGRFASPQGTSYSERSLAPGTHMRPYHVYEVIHSFEVKAGLVAPWFDEVGGGTQYSLPNSVEELVQSGMIRRITP